jgi:hypothetical protein
MYEISIGIYFEREGGGGGMLKLKMFTIRLRHFDFSLKGREGGREREVKYRGSKLSQIYSPPR